MSRADQRGRSRRRPRGGQPPVERLREALRGVRPDAEQTLFEEIAGQVADLREGWGLSQRELAELCGTTQSAIARMERGSRPPRIDTLQRVAAALDSELVVELRPRTRSAAAPAARPKGPEGQTKRRDK